VNVPVSVLGLGAGLPGRHAYTQSSPSQSWRLIRTRDRLVLLPSCSCNPKLDLTHSQTGREAAAHQVAATTSWPVSRRFLPLP
jgi:hypothetical protein